MENKYQETVEEYTGMSYVDRNGQIKRQKLMKPGCGFYRAMHYSA